MDWKDRRKTVRLPAEHPMRARLVGSAVGMILVDISEGGFAVAGDEPLPFATHLDFAFSTPDDAWSATVSARAAYCLAQPCKVGPYAGRYLAGFAFLQTAESDARAQIRELIDRVVVHMPA
jgi:hypothetical protein